MGEPAALHRFQFSPGQRAFLDAPRKAVIATMRTDGTVEQTIVYYLLDGDTLWISANPEGGKARDLRRDPRVSILIYADAQSAYISIEGHACVTEDLDDRARAELMTSYLGADGAAKEVAAKPKLRPNARIRVLPTRALSFNVPD